MKISVLGTGCANCRSTYALVEQTAARLGVPVELDKVEDIREIMRYRVMGTPAVVVDGVVVHAGGVPTAARVESWLRALPKTSCCGSGAKSKCCG
jgi:small redox-active disulfide protein 2